MASLIRAWTTPPTHPLAPPTHPPARATHSPAAAKTVYGTALANVDWLHGGAEFFLTLTNLFIVLGLRDAIRKAEAANAAKAAAGTAAQGQSVAGAAAGSGVEEGTSAALRE